MSWKEFFRPDWRKIIVTMIILVPYIWISPRGGACAYRGSCNYIILPFLTMAALVITNNLLIVSGLRITSDISLTITPFFILDVFICYFLSCTLIRIYENVRGRKK